MQYSLFAFALTAISLVNAIPAADKTTGCVDGTKMYGACSYTVTCNAQISDGTVYGSKTEKSYANCMKLCTGTNEDIGGCASFTYDIASQNCTLYNSGTTTTHAKGYDSAVTEGCE